MSYVFVADDFTGASDTLATLSRIGLRARLFRDVPSVEDVAELDAWGIATPARSLGRTAIEQLGQRIGKGLAAHVPNLVHVKVCSTFDSGPDLGNIAAFSQAIAKQTGIPDIAVVGGQPSLGRYAVFGTLFARGPDNAIHRIDRHPVMSKHPVTPMTEADLIRHLGRLGLDGLYYVGRCQQGQDFPRFYDVLEQADLNTIGRDLKACARSLVVMGPSSVAEAWFAGHVGEHISFPTAAVPSGRPIFAFAGSRSSVTTAQIGAARMLACLPIDPRNMIEKGSVAREAFNWVKDRLERRQNVIVYLTAEGSGTITPGTLALVSAEFVKRVVYECRPGGLIVAGGDTASAIVNAVAPDWLDYADEICAGVPVLRSKVNGADLSLALKGGQMGNTDFFETAIRALNRA
ncbi:four-carbon acid sugar kinase family protein [Paracoccus marcusii]|uniref:four-carbon acid sugar kinase family protein n=1 Tax=Paracoccus marcusii TaxID=59779 RepID=UPI003266AADF